MADMIKKYLVAIFSSLIVLVVNAQKYDNLVFTHRLNPEKDNTIFTPGKELTYSYKIYDKDGHQLAIVRDQSAKWKLSELSDVEKVLTFIKYTVIQPKIFQRTNNGQTEVVISCDPDFKTFERTGVVDNPKNKWMHPPRTNYFRVLETCPFPYVKLPVEKGREWNEAIKVSDRWSDPGWGEWEDDLLMKINYKIIGQENVETTEGIFSCAVIQGKAESVLGETGLISYFNEKAGFVKLEYKTMNNLLIVFQLNDINEIEPIKGYKKYLRMYMMKNHKEATGGNVYKK